MGRSAHPWFSMAHRSCLNRMIFITNPEHIEQDSSSSLSSPLLLKDLDFLLSMPLYIGRSATSTYARELPLPCPSSFFIYIDHPLFYIFIHLFCFVFLENVFFNSFSLSSSIRLSLLSIVSTCVQLSAQNYLFVFVFLFSMIQLVKVCEKKVAKKRIRWKCSWNGSFALVVHLLFCCHFFPLFD